MESAPSLKSICPEKGESLLGANNLIKCEKVKFDLIIVSNGTVNNENK